MVACRKCGNKLTSVGFGELCPRCLLSDGLEAPPAPSSDSTHFITPLLTRSFGDYDLLSEVARGGMGVIYRAKQRSLGRIVAVKVLSAGEFASPEYVRRFRAEAAASARLQHPNIVAIHEVGEHDGVQYFSMDFVEGPNLAELMRERPLPPKRAADYLKVLAEAIQYAHGQGILHRDLKPSNVLIDPFGEPRITDFGLAKDIGAVSDLTAPGQVLGTPGYLPPEQADSTCGPMGPASDIYSLGAILYFMLTGRAPFVSGSLHETLRLVLASEPVSPRLLNPGVPRDLETICLKCLEKEPARRYASARELTQELERFLNGMPILARRIGVPEHVWRWYRRQPALATLGATVLLLLVTVAVGSTVAAVRIAAARDAQESERRRAERTVNRLELQQADHLLRDDQVSSALAHLASVLRKEPTNRVAAARIASVLMERSFPLPVCPPIRQESTVTAVAFSSDGRSLATASADGVARIWDAETGQALSSPLRHFGGINLVHFSPDGRRLYTTSSDKAARIWDARTGEQIGSSMAHEDGVKLSELSEDGTALITLTADFLRVWDVLAGRLRFPPLAHGIGRGHGLSMAVSADGRRTVVGGSDGQVKVCDLGEGRWVLTKTLPAALARITDIEINRDASLMAASTYNKQAVILGVTSGQIRATVQHKDVIEYCAFSPDGQRLATASRDGTAAVWDTQSGAALGAPLRHFTNVKFVRFSPEGRRLLTTCWDNTAWIWDLTTGKTLTEPIRHDNRIVTADFSPDGQRVATGSIDHTAMIWDIQSGEQIPLSFRNHGDSGVAFNPSGSRLLTWSTDGTARVWNPQTGEPVTPILRHANWIVNGRFSPDGARVVTASHDRSAVVWDAATGQRVASLRGHSNVVEFAEFSPDGQSVITGSRDATAALWNLATGTIEVRFVGHRGRLWSARFSPDGQQVVTASDDGTMRIWNARTGQPVGNPLAHRAGVYAANFSPDGERIVTASTDMTARIVDARTGIPLSRPLKHTSGLRSAEFSPDGSRVLTASGDNSARIWDSRTGKLLGEPILHLGEVWMAVFGRDGKLVATASLDGSTRVWDGWTGQPLTEPLRQTGRFSRTALSPNGRWIASGQGNGDAFLWEVPEVELAAPDWLADLAEAVACQRVVEQGFEFVSPAELVAVRRQQVRAHPADAWERFARWFFANRRTRNLSPSSLIAKADMIDRLVEENTFESLREALRFAPDRSAARQRMIALVVAPRPAGSGSWSDSDPFVRWVMSLPEGRWAQAKRFELSDVRRAWETIQTVELALTNNAAFYVDKGRIAARVDALEVALSAFERVASLSGQETELALAAVGRRNVLLRLNRRAEAAATGPSPLTIGARDARAGPDQIDLSDFFNASPDAPWHTILHPNNNLRGLPRGTLPLADVTYDVRGIIQLAGRSIHQWAPGYPRAVTGIPVRRRCQRLHFLHGTGWGGSVASGTTIGQYRVNFADGQIESIPIRIGEDLEEWQGPVEAKPELKRAQVVWTGVTPQGNTARLYHRAWDNPRPDQEIASVEFSSTETAAAPFLLAITAEGTPER